MYRNPYNGYSEGEYGYGDQGGSSGHNTSGETVEGGEGRYAGQYGTQASQQGWPRAGYRGGDSNQGTGVQGAAHRAGMDGGTYRTGVGSQTVLLSVPTKVMRVRWPRGSDFLFSTWSFTLSLHSLWTLPVVVIQQGGLVFLLMYSLLALLLGFPLLLLEMALGQYSGLPTPRLWRHLCPLLSGLGLTLVVVSIVRALLELAVLSWAGQALFLLFSQQDIGKEVFRDQVLDREETGLGNLGSLGYQGLVVLGVVTLVTFLLAGAGTRALGKVSMLAVPACFMLVVTLVIRACLAAGGPQGVLSLLSPDWAVLKEPGVWLEAATQVVFSLQLGLGAISSYSAYNRYQHNILRDCAVLLVSNLVWVLLTTLLTCSLLGMALQADNLSLPPNSDPLLLVSQTGHNVWLAAVTMLQQSFTLLSQAWLWAGLYFLLLLLTGLTSLFGHLEVISSSLLSMRPSHTRWQPLVSLFVLSCLFLVSLVITTQGGVEVYHLLLTYLASWPALLVCLLTCLAASVCHKTKYLMKDVRDMSKVSLPHWVSSHLSVSYYTTVPGVLAASLCWSLYNLSLDHLQAPLSHFKISLAEGPAWALPLAWSLAALPALPVVGGALVVLAWVRKGVPLGMHLKRLIKPTDRWYQNEHLENLSTGPVSSSSSA